MLPKRRSVRPLTRPLALAFATMLAIACADGDEPVEQPLTDSELLDATDASDVASPGPDAEDTDAPVPDTAADATPSVDADTDASSEPEDTLPPGCEPPETLCGEQCVDLASDESACGSCDTSCTANERCVNGGCICADGLTRCAGACVALASDPLHCGGCDLRCGEGSVCAEGVCRLDCPTGLTECDAACLDLTSDPLHCGACGAACDVPDNTAAACVAGACASTCLPTFYDLDGAPGCEYACEGAPGETERCDGVDNDCNGLVDADDPDAVLEACPLALGVCEGATRPCDAATSCGASDYEAAATARGLSYVEDEVALCDGVDNDCDGELDEGCCGRDVSFSLTGIDSTFPLDGWFVLDARTQRLGDRFAHAYVAVAATGGNGSHIGELEIRDLVVDALWQSELPEHFGEDVIAVTAGRGAGESGLRWLVHRTRDVSEGETDASGVFVSPLAPAPFGEPEPGQVVDVVVTTDGSGYAVVTRETVDPGYRVTLYDRIGDGTDWAAYTSSYFDRIEGMTVYDSTNGLRACAQTTLDEERYVRCWRMTPEGAFDYEQVIGRSAAEGTPQRGLPFGDGIALYYDTYGPPCPGFCQRTIRRAVVDASGEINTSVLPFTSTAGAVRVYPGPNGEHWLLSADASATADAFSIVYTLYQEGDAGFVRIARMSGNAPLPPGGVVFDDRTVWVLMSTLDAAAKGATAPPQSLYAVPFAHDGAALCGPHLAD